MLQNNLSISKILGIIIGSPSILGLSLIIYSLIFEGINESQEDFWIFVLMTVFVLMFFVAGVGLYLHKLWGRAIATSCIVLIMIGFTIMLVAVLSDYDEETLVVVSLVIPVLIACSGVLLLLYNNKVTKELLSDAPNMLNDEILDNHLH